MTGPEHYREAEKDIHIADGSSIDDGSAGYFLARAQVHATLALAAATSLVAGQQATIAEADGSVRLNVSAREDWAAAIGPKATS